MDVPPMIFTGNPLIIKPGMVFFMHMILMDSKSQLAMKDELNTKNMIDRYSTIFVFCKIYVSWALLKKDEQIHDITKKKDLM